MLAPPGAQAQDGRFQIDPGAVQALASAAQAAQRGDADPYASLSRRGDPLLARTGLRGVVASGVSEYLRVLAAADYDVNDSAVRVNSFGLRRILSSGEAEADDPLMAYLLRAGQLTAPLTPETWEGHPFHAELQHTVGNDPAPAGGVLAIYEVRTGANVRGTPSLESRANIVSSLAGGARVEVDLTQAGANGETEWVRLAGGAGWMHASTVSLVSEVTPEPAAAPEPVAGPCGVTTDRIYRAVTEVALEGTTPRNVPAGTLLMAITNITEDSLRLQDADGTCRVVALRDRSGNPQVVEVN